MSLVLCYFIKIVFFNTSVNNSEKYLYNDIFFNTSDTTDHLKSGSALLVISSVNCSWVIILKTVG